MLGHSASHLIMCFTEQGKLYRFRMVGLKWSFVTDCLNFHLHEDECELQADNREEEVLLFLFLRDLPYAEI